MARLELAGKGIRVVLNDDMSLSVRRRRGRLLWESSRSHTPAVVATGGGESRTLPLGSASDVSVSAFGEGRYRGRSLRLGGFAGLDVWLELALAIDDASDELLIQASQVGGKDTVNAVRHLYRFEKPAADGGYLVLPHGSGYLIPADCPDELPGKGLKGGFIGARWTMPLFGIVRGEQSLCVIVDTWWDCDVEADHVPGQLSALDFHWAGSLGKLAYPRRQIIRFSDGMDYAAMAKLYRSRAAEQGLVRTLEEKSDVTPVIRRYVENILLRWPAWNTEDGPAVLADIRRLRQMGLGANFFFPKWSSSGYSPERSKPTTAHANWQAYLLDNPVPGGWASLVEYAGAVREMGCTIQGFLCPIMQDPEGPRYDEDRWPLNSEGNRPREFLSTHDALDRTRWAFDKLEAVGQRLDVLYYDGFSAYLCLPEDFSPSHPVSRRCNIENENACFAETRRRGVMPGAELARFWCIPECDYFFFTDWSSDRLSNTPVQGAPAPVGEPVPLFGLVFHDCYIAGFSGGGYALYAPGYDWWADRTPRLYELLFASAPAYNWLPEPYVPIRDWESEKARHRLDWLKLWSSYYRTVAMSEMVSHQFLSSDRTAQRIEFENGVAAEFDMAGNRLRVTGVPGFSGEWETPPEL
jgi:hypothetical protein